MSGNLLIQYIYDGNAIRWCLLLTLIPMASFVIFPCFVLFGGLVSTGRWFPTDRGDANHRSSRSVSAEFGLLQRNPAVTSHFRQARHNDCADAGV